MNFENVKKDLLLALSERGISEYEIYVSDVSDLSVDTLDGAVSAFSSSERGGVCLKVIKNNRAGYASSELFTAQQMRDLVLRAEENALVCENECEVLLFGGSDKYNTSEATPISLSADELKSTALTLSKRLFDGCDAVGRGSATSALCHSARVSLVNSCGIDLSYSVSVGAAYAEAVVERDGERQSDYSIKAISAECDEKINLIAEDATEKALSKIGASLIPSGKYDVVIDASAMRALLGTFSSSFSGRAALRGMSRLRDKEGERIASEVVTVTDDPMREGSRIHIPFDAEGVATERRVVVDRGVLLTLLHNRETAKLLGKTTTANASKASYSSPVGVSPYSLAIESGTTSRESLFEAVSDGIYITEVKGLHAGANAVTGDFSLESEGFMIRGGKRAEAVKSFTVSGNFFELLLSVEAVASDLDIGVPMGATSFGSPSILVRGMSVAGE